MSLLDLFADSFHGPFILSDIIKVCSDFLHEAVVKRLSTALNRSIIAEPQLEARLVSLHNNTYARCSSSLLALLTVLHERQQKMILVMGIIHLHEVRRPARDRLKKNGSNSISRD